MAIILFGSLAGTALILAGISIGMSLLALRRSKVEYRVVQAPKSVESAEKFLKELARPPGVQNLERDLAMMNGEAMDDDEQPGEDEEALV